MNRHYALMMVQTLSVPRTRGDEPDNEENLQATQLCSPPHAGMNRIYRTVQRDMMLNEGGDSKAK